MIEMFSIDDGSMLFVVVGLTSTGVLWFFLSFLSKNLDSRLRSPKTKIQNQNPYRLPSSPTSSRSDSASPRCRSRRR